MPEVEDDSDEAGGSTITSYHLEWKQPSDAEFQALIGGSGDNLNRLITVDTVPGLEYLFRYRVANVFGWSSGYSDQVSILSAMPPLTPDVATTEIQGSYVKISWNPPDDNFAPILAY